MYCNLYHARGVQKQNILVSASYLPVTWQAAIIFTHYMMPFIAPFFILLISSVIVLPSVDILDAQLPLQYQTILNSEHSLFQL